MARRSPPAVEDGSTIVCLAAAGTERRFTALEKLGDIIPKVTEVFEDACRFIDGHSQPLATLGVSPTLAGLEQHWAQLQELKKVNEGRA